MIHVFEHLRSGARVLGVAIALLAAAGCAHRAPQHFTGTVLPSKPAADFRLTDQNGRPFDLAGQRGRAVILFFGYTHCPDVCPATMAQLARVYHTLTPAQREHVRVAFVTVDPQRDDVKTLKQYIDLYDPSFVGLTGTPAQLAPVYDAYHVWHQRLRGTKATGYLVAHGSSIYLIDPAGNLRVLHDWQDPASAIGADVKELLA
jgi:protein SCO1